MISKELPIGTLVDGPSFQLFFGNKNSSLEALRAEFPKLSWAKIKQVHGAHVVHSQNANSTPEADAHWTLEKNLALCISTADCMPIFFISESSPKHIFAIHAGWRGVAQKIVPKALETFRSLLTADDHIRIYIGPHIRQDSFAVDADCKDLLLASFPQTASSPVFFELNGKFHVDLEKIVLGQIAESKLAVSNISSQKQDTKTDENYHSFRRARENAGRQISFIVLK